MAKRFIGGAAEKRLPVKRGKWLLVDGKGGIGPNSRCMLDTDGGSCCCAPMPCEGCCAPSRTYHPPGAPNLCCYVWENWINETIVADVLNVDYYYLQVDSFFGIEIEAVGTGSGKVFSRDIFGGPAGCTYNFTVFEGTWTRREPGHPPQTEDLGPGTSVGFGPQYYLEDNFQRSQFARWALPIIDSRHSIPLGHVRRSQNNGNQIYTEHQTCGPFVSEAIEYRSGFSTSVSRWSFEVVPLTLSGKSSPCCIDPYGGNNQSCRTRL